MLQEFTVPVYGPEKESIPTLTHRFREYTEKEKEEGNVYLSEFSLSLKVLDIPGHTAGHIAYYGANLLFCGDTLFGCGCGRLFEGTARQMVDSLEKLLICPKKH